jgi:hypothetical protein
MISYSHQYLDIRAVCEHNELDVEAVMQHLCDSDISFGSNYDTLISQHHLQSIIDLGFDNVQLDFGGYDDTVVISLGS